MSHDTRITGTDITAAADFVERFRLAWANRDPEALGALFHADAEVDYPTEEGMIDRAGVVAFWRAVLPLVPTMQVGVVTWAHAGDDVFIEWESTIAGDGGERAVQRGVDRFTLRDGRAVSEGNYWDTHAIRPLLEGAR
jgi:ketosteroid isomerase-like protein